MDRLSELIAKSDIEDVLFRYARAVDRRDWSALRACFHEDAIDEHGEFRGGLEAFIEWVSKRHANVPFSMHFLGNCLIEFLDDATAAVETYFIAIQRRETPATLDNSEIARTDLEVFARYCDRFENRDGVWRIAHRRVAYDSTRNQPSSDHLRQLVGVIGRRDRQDPIFSLNADVPTKASDGYVAGEVHPGLPPK